MFIALQLLFGDLQQGMWAAPIEKPCAWKFGLWCIHTYKVPLDSAVLNVHVQTTPWGPWLSLQKDAGGKFGLLGYLRGDCQLAREKDHSSLFYFPSSPRFTVAADVCSSLFRIYGCQIWSHHWSDLRSNEASAGCSGHSQHLPDDRVPPLGHQQWPEVSRLFLSFLFLPLSSFSCFIHNLGEVFGFKLFNLAGHLRSCMYVSWK